MGTGEQISAMIDAAEDAHHLRERIAELEAALRPFAQKADEMDSIYAKEKCDDDALVACLTYGEAKAARGALQNATVK